MHDTAKTLKNSIYMLTVNSSVIIIVAYGTFWLKHYNYYLTDPQDFSGSYFTETLLFFLTMILDVTSVVFVSYVGGLMLT